MTFHSNNSRFARRPPRAGRGRSGGLWVEAEAPPGRGSRSPFEAWIWIIGFSCWLLVTNGAGEQRTGGVSGCVFGVSLLFGLQVPGTKSGRVWPCMRDRAATTYRPPTHCRASHRCFVGGLVHTRHFLRQSSPRLRCVCMKMQDKWPGLIPLADSGVPCHLDACQFWGGLMQLRMLPEVRVAQSQTKRSPQGWPTRYPRHL